MISGIEIFSGAGGLATGLGLSGVNHKAFIEWNTDACKTLRKNYDHAIVHECDIRTFDFSPYKGVDIIAGGPPCQPFSLGGKARGNLDERDMFPSAIRSIKELLPKIFLFENVKGLLRSNFKEYLDYILLQLEFPTIEVGLSDYILHSRRAKDQSVITPLNEQYNVTIKLVNAADYGVPQKRERVIIVGVRKDLNKLWTMPEPTHSYDSLLWSKYVTHAYWENNNIHPTESEYKTFSKHRMALENKYGFLPPDLLPWKTIREALKNPPVAGNADYYYSEHIVRDGAREYYGHTGSPIDEPAKTIKAGGHGVPGGENMIKFDDGSFRYFTVFEAKRIQTFPDEYHIVGSWTESMRQIGNAVPVLLAKIIAKSLLDIL